MVDFGFGIFINDLSKKQFLGPIYVINAIKDVGHMERNPREIIVQLSIIKILVTSQGFSLVLSYVARFSQRSSNHVVAVTQSTVEIHCIAQLSFVVSENNIKSELGLGFY